MAEIPRIFSSVEPAAPGGGYAGEAPRVPREGAQALGNAFEHFLEVNKKMRDAQTELDALGVMQNVSEAFARKQAILLENPDPATHMDNLKSAINDVRSEYVDSIPNPDVRQRVLKSFTQASTLAIVQGVHDTHSLQLKKWDDELVSQNDNAVNVIRGPSTFDEAVNAETTAVAGMQIRKKKGAVSPERERMELLKFKDAWFGKINDFAVQRPADFVTYDDKGQLEQLKEKVTPHQWVQIRQGAETRAETQYNRARADLERQLKLDSHREQTQIMLGALDPNRDQAGLLKRLSESAVKHDFSREDVATLEKAITSPPRETASDPLVYTQMVEGIHSVRPSVTFPQLTQAFRAEKLNLKDYVAFRDKLTTRMDHMITEERTIGLERFTAAKTELKAALNIPDIISEKIDPVRATIYADLLGTLGRRSFVLGGKEDPLAVARDELIPEAYKRLNLNLDGKLQDWNAQLKVQGARELEAAKAQGFGPNKTIKSKEDYENQRRIILERDRALQEYGQYQKPIGPEKPQKPKGFFEGLFGPSAPPPVSRGLEQRRGQP